MNHAAFPGDELRARREDLGLSSDDIYRRIRVPAHFVESIEAGAVHNLPAACYSVGFLKTYCQLLNLDANRYVDTYQACVRPQKTFLRRSAPEPRNSNPPRWMAEAMAWAAVCGVIALGWLTYTVVVQPNAAATEQRAHAATADDIRVPATPKQPAR
ncbi:MAG TPA: helix-turn-helix domain-containing protein [Candidatus Hydrogenedentes bacterium]|nr:helix-turn-helix domain-containing protein [Candidatus Hydrogenedentota bacterium]HRK35020.1 helix-turn-helix domain-containing protein [Candidatus Hydrogenedentota bacterium]